MEKTSEQIEKELSAYLGKGFNDDQILEIREGIIRGLNVSFYARPDFSASQMRKIWNQLNAQKAEYEDKQREIAELEAKIKKTNEDVILADKQKRRRENAVIAFVLAAIGIVLSIYKVIEYIKTIIK